MKQLVVTMRNDDQFFSAPQRDFDLLPHQLKSHGEGSVRWMKLDRASGSNMWLNLDEVSSFDITDYEPPKSKAPVVPPPPLKNRWWGR